MIKKFKTHIDEIITLPYNTMTYKMGCLGMIRYFFNLKENHNIKPQ